MGCVRERRDLVQMHFGISFSWGVSRKRVLPLRSQRPGYNLLNALNLTPFLGGLVLSLRTTYHRRT